MSNRKTKRIPTMMLAMCAMFAALMAIGAWISIPIFSIPVTLQLLAILVCAALLKPTYAALSVVVYILLGVVGVPVFSNFTSGPARLLSITGGYIIGFVPAAWITSLMMNKWGREIWKQVIAMVVGVAVCYVFGTIWFMVLNGQNTAAFNASLAGLTEAEIAEKGGMKTAYTLEQTLSMCILPYIPFDAVKIAISVALSKVLWKPFQMLCHRA